MRWLTSALSVYAIAPVWQTVRSSTYHRYACTARICRPALTTLFLSRLSHGGHLSCSPAATRLLMRMDLPGNAEQLHQMLREVVKHRRTGPIGPADLPPEAHTVSRRVLSSLETMERDAIVRSLAEAREKTQAARSLGMSRATIYRKIHDYGIVTSTG